MPDDRSSGNEEGLLIELTTPSGEKCTGRLLDVERTVVSIGLSTDEGQALPVDQKTTLVVPDGPDGPMELAGRVVSRREGGGQSEYEIALHDRDAIGRLSRLCNKRGAYRVRPGSSLEIKLKTLQGTHEATLHDLSVSGLGVIVSPEAEQAMAGTQALVIRFGPPAFAEPFVMRGTIRHRTAVVAGIRYGVELVAEDSTASIEGQKRLTEYVMQRQRDTAGRRPA